MSIYASPFNCRPFYRYSFLFLNINKINAVGEIKNVNGYNVETAYEINEVYIENNQIHLKGWYVAKGIKILLKKCDPFIFFIYYRNK